jgi:hypothetical protein
MLGLGQGGDVLRRVMQGRQRAAVRQFNGVACVASSLPSHALRAGVLAYQHNIHRAADACVGLIKGSCPLSSD